MLTLRVCVSSRIKKFSGHLICFCSRVFSFRVSQSIIVGTELLVFCQNLLPGTCFLKLPLFSGLLLFCQTTIGEYNPQWKRKSLLLVHLYQLQILSLPARNSDKFMFILFFTISMSFILIIQRSRLLFVGLTHLVWVHDKWSGPLKTAKVLILSFHCIFCFVSKIKIPLPYPFPFFPPHLTTDHSLKPSFKAVLGGRGLKNEGQK